MYVQLLLLTCALQLGRSQSHADIKNSTACFNDASQRNVTLNCRRNFISVFHVYVGFDHLCSFRPNVPLCPFHSVLSNNAYYWYIMSKCNGKTSCQLRSEEVKEERFKGGFHLCGGIKDKNAVRLEYSCQRNPPITTGSAIATVTDLMLTYSTPSEETTSQAATSSSTTDRMDVEQINGAKEKQVMSFPLPTILGIVAGGVIVLALLCLGMVLLLRHRQRKSKSDHHKRKGPMADSTDDFTYYSTISGDGSKRVETPNVKPRPLPPLASPPTEDNYQQPHYEDVDNVYSELDSPTKQHPANLATNHLYSLCEPSPPCSCLTNQLRVKPVDLVNNSLYHKAYETSVSVNEH